MKDYENVLKDIRRYENLKERDLKKKKSLEEEIKLCEARLKELNAIKQHFEKGIESYSSFQESLNQNSSVGDSSVGTEESFNG